MWVLLLSLLMTTGVLQQNSQQASTPAVITESMEGRYKRLIKELDSPDWNTREAATHALARDTKGVSMGRIEGSLEAGGLSLEQVVRLLRVVEIRLLHAPRGALGIQMLVDQPRAGDFVRFEPEPRGVRVSAVIPGLPAEKVLEVGDVITNINEIPINRRDDLARIVQEHWPGEVLQLRVNRSRRIPPQNEVEEEVVVESVEVEITLGSTELLRSSGGARSVLDPGLSDRKQKMTDLLQRYGAVPSTIPSPSNVDLIRSEADMNDPVIRGVLQQLEGILNGTFPTPMEQMRPQWVRRISAIEVTLRRDDLTPQQRAQLEYRRDRLQEIIDFTQP